MIIKEYNYQDVHDPRTLMTLDCQPSVFECEQAFHVAQLVIRHNQDRLELPEDDPCYMDAERMLRAILCEVWRAARVYQRNKDAKACMGALA